VRQFSEAVRQFSEAVRQFSEAVRQFSFESLSIQEFPRQSSFAPPCALDYSSFETLLAPKFVQGY